MQDARSGPPPALVFDESMTGHVSTQVGAGADFSAGAALGRVAGTSVRTELTITCRDLPALLADPAQPARIGGQVIIPSLSEQPLQVVEGSFVLMKPDPLHVETATMRYTMVLEAASPSGDRYVLDGYKVIHVGPVTRTWHDTTTLYVTIYKGEDIDELATAPVYAKGILGIAVPGVASLLRSIRIEHARPSDRRFYRNAFALRFVGSLWPFYAGSLDERSRFPQPPPEPPPFPTLGTWKPIDARWCDPGGTWYPTPVPGACSRLIRYGGSGRKGPVVLGHAFAMSSTSYALTFQQPSLTQYLLDNGYDVWLFDYRTSTELPSAWSPSTLDEIATIDWPRAVDYVYAATNRKVQAFGHCAGSVTLLMALLAGMEHVRSVICSQFTVHPVTSTLNRAKAWLKLGPLMADLGTARLDPSAPLNLRDVAIDLAIRPVPVPHGERCGLAVCRWINGIYGMTHVHAQLTDQLHEELPNLFGVGNLTGLRHLLLILQQGRAVDAWGLDRYLPHAGRLTMPIHFVAGTQNYIFHPEGTQRTMDWLTATHGRSFASRHFSATYLPGYGHLDALVGRDVATDVFPDILQHLDRHP